uniref:Beta-1,4-xylanase n=1 Tax=Noccaea caerulescens TaxID=107243 RepID=A0A1J3JL47_NOCCA
MMDFVRANRIIARGHNIFWEDPRYTPAWVLNLTGEDLRSAVNRRISSLMTRYRSEFVHWDVSNEMLHFDFYESRLGKNASYGFFAAAREYDSLATLFLNDFNVVETCSDEKSTVDEYIARVRELERYEGGGVRMDGVGLEGHFTVPNAALMRANLDKLASLELPIWLTEIDISSTLDRRTQVNLHFIDKYLPRINQHLDRLLVTNFGGLLLCFRRYIWSKCYVKGSRTHR